MVGALKVGYSMAWVNCTEKPLKRISGLFDALDLQYALSVIG
jgi:hypothetical protein